MSSGETKLPKDLSGVSIMRSSEATLPNEFGGYQDFVPSLCNGGRSKVIDNNGNLTYTAKPGKAQKAKNKQEAKSKFYETIASNGLTYTQAQAILGHLNSICANSGRYCKDVGQKQLGVDKDGRPYYDLVIHLAPNPDAFPPEMKAMYDRAKEAIDELNKKYPNKENWSGENVREEPPVHISAETKKFIDDFMKEIRKGR